MSGTSFNSTMRLKKIEIRTLSPTVTWNFIKTAIELHNILNVTRPRLTKNACKPNQKQQLIEGQTKEFVPYLYSINVPHNY